MILYVILFLDFPISFDKCHYSLFSIHCSGRLRSMCNFAKLETDPLAPMDVVSSHVTYHVKHDQYSQRSGHLQGDPGVSDAHSIVEPENQSNHKVNTFLCLKWVQLLRCLSYILQSIYIYIFIRYFQALFTLFGFFFSLEPAIVEWDAPASGYTNHENNNT